MKITKQTTEQAEEIELNDEQLNQSDQDDNPFFKDQSYSPKEGDDESLDAFFKKEVNKILSKEEPRDDKSKKKTPKEANDEIKNELGIDLNKILGTKEDESEEEPESDDKKDPEDDDGDDEKDELDKVDISQVKTKDGKPVSVQVSKFIDDLKRDRQEKAKLIKQLQEEINKKAVESEEYIKLKNENEELKQRFDLELFRESPAFKEAYEKPIERARDNLKKYIANIPEDDKVEATKLFQKAWDYALNGNEAEFSDVVDELASNVLRAGTAKTTQFANAMDKWYEAIQQYSNVFKLKSEQREKAIKTRLSQMRQESISSAEHQIEMFTKEFEIQRKPIIKALDEKNRQEYLNAIQTAKEDIKSELVDFATTGQISERLSKALSQAAVYESINKELSLAWHAYKNLLDKTKVLEEELNEAKESLKVASYRGSSSRHSNSSFSAKGKSSKKAERFENILDDDVKKIFNGAL